MANVPLRTLKFPGLPNTYTVPPVDDTLSVSGAIADAKKTGDEITQLKSDSQKISETIDNIIVESVLNVNWAQGNINSSTGGNTTSTYRIRTSEYLHPSFEQHIAIPEGMKAFVYKYSSPEVTGFIGADGKGWHTENFVIQKGYYYRFVGAYVGDRDILPSAGSDIVVTDYAPTDPTLSKENKAADAKITGDKITQLQSGLTAEIDAREEADTAINEALETKAEIDGYYDEMAVGSAEQLISTVLTVDEEPYKFRTSGGMKDIGNRETDKIVGGSIVWNQIMNYASFASFAETSGITVTNNRDGSIMLNGTATEAVAIVIQSGVFPTNSHVCFVSMGSDIAGAYIYDGYTVDGTAKFSGGFIKNPADTKRQFRIRFESGTVLDNIKLYPQLFDITAMFGTAVANYIYSLEQASAGAGVAYLKKLFPNDYYAYNSGELMHVSGLQSHDMVGFNQWDEEWENGRYNNITGKKVTDSTAIRSKNRFSVFPNTVYYCAIKRSGTDLYMWFYDADDEFISYTKVTNKTVTTPLNAFYARISTYAGNYSAYNNDICINLSWSGYRNGEYEPYKKHSYALDSSLTLRGIPKIGTDGIYFDGDTYESDGTVTRRCGVVDLGTLDWRIVTDHPTEFRATDMPDRKIGSDAVGFCDRYTFWGNGTTTNLWNGLENMQFGYQVTNAFIAIRNDECDSVAKIKAALQGVMLVYEMATPVTETANPYTNPQIVDDFGTEEYVSETIVPVGHYTEYPENLRSKIEGLPWNFDNLIASTEKVSKASKSYAVGDYLIYQNTLYKVIATITSGETLTVGTNISATTIMAEIKALQ